MNIEKEGFSIENMHNELITGKWEWLMGYTHPEVFSPGRVPQDTRYPTHVFNSKFNDVVNVWKASSDVAGTIVNHPERAGKFWIYFAPVSDLLEMSSNPVHDALNNNVVFNTTYYATSNGPLRQTDFNNLYNIDIGPENLGRKSNGPFQGYKKLRVNSAALMITPTGPLRSNSGIIKVGYAFRRTDLDFTKINFQTFENYFQESKIYQVKADKNIICRYRPTKNLLDDFAPYEPTEDMPYFVIYGEGISPEVTFQIKVIRHFEGIAMSQYSQLFYNNWKMKPIDYYIQKLAASALRNPEIISMESQVDNDGNVQLTIDKVSHIFNHVFETIYKEGPSLFEDNSKLTQEGIYDVARLAIDKMVPSEYKDIATLAMEAYDPKMSMRDNMVKLGKRYGADLIISATLAKLINK